MPSFPRIDGRKLPTDLALGIGSGDIHADGKGDIATVSGLAALPQKIQVTLSMQQGESPFHPTFGSRFFEYFEIFRGSVWLTELLKLELVRQLAIPYADNFSKMQYTSLQCVNRINSLELLAEAPIGNRMPVRLDLDVQGVGPWQCEVAVYVPTKKQMDQLALRRAELAPIFSGGL